MGKRSKVGRPRKTGPLRSEVVSIRLLEDERAMLEQAAGDLPLGIWARIAVVQAAREALARGKGKGRDRA